MSSIDTLLNHEAAASGRRESLATMAQPPFSATATATATATTPTTTYEAADALTALASLGSGQQYAHAHAHAHARAPSRELPSPTASTNAPRRSSSFGSHHSHRAPVEPSPPIDQPSPHARSPTLDHYHHASQSPQELQRRQSLLARSSPAPVLAPIQDLSSALQDQSSSSATPIGHDVSQRVPHTETPSHGTGTGTGTDSTQDREPAFVRDDPHTLHIREPEPSTNEPRDKDETSVKSETPADAIASAIDTDTLKAIEAAKQSDLGLRAKRTASVAESVTSPTEPKPAPAPSKKRPAPSSSGVKKKGTAKTTKPSNKKRKIDDDDAKARSVTPTSRSRTGKKGSQAGTPALQSSPAPEDTAYAHDDDDDSSEDHNLYCICKKPDNHKWMIGCDGGCDDWFHGDCVDMKQADEHLVDKFICPMCDEAGKGHTTWKAMCRRDGCRKPARVTKDHPSKYCSDDCGVLFMQEQLQRTAGAKGANTKDRSKKKKKVVRPEDDGDDEEEPTPLGGVLRAKDLKALVEASPNIQAFKNLGSGVLSPPHTASPTRTTFTGNPDDVALTAAETERLTALHNEKSQLNDRLEVLKDREKFVSMAKEQATRVAEREKMKLKEFCGYDSRLSWSDAEFLLWRNSTHGRAAFQFSTLSPTPDQIASSSSSSPSTSPSTPAVDVKDAICLKKRCPKHPQWQKLNLQDARFEELEVVEAVRECEKEERSVRERARRRHARDAMARELTAGEAGQGAGGKAGEVRNRDGWVEVVAGLS